MGFDVSARTSQPPLSTTSTTSQGRTRFSDCVTRILEEWLEIHMGYTDKNLKKRIRIILQFSYCKTTEN